MYRKLLLGICATLIVPLSTKSLALNTDPSNTRKNLECAANVSSTKYNQNTKKIDFDEVNASPVRLGRGTVHKFLTFSTIGSRIQVKFSPRDPQEQPLALQSLAATLGYQSFNWVNYVEKDPHGMTNHQGELLTLPYNDPPSGGYQYDAADNYPFYWDIEQCENCHYRHNYQHPKVKQKFALNFEDSPSDYRLKEGETIEFITHLVGVKNYNLEQNEFSWDVLSSFKWQLTNDAAGRGQITLIAVNLKTSELSPSILAQIQNDGGIIPQLPMFANLDKDNFHSHQCQLQSHQNLHLDSHL